MQAIKKSTIYQSSYYYDAASIDSNHIVATVVYVLSVVHVTMTRCASTE